MTKGLKAWLYVCISGVILGFALLFSAGAQAADNTTPKPESTTSVTEKSNGDVVTNKTETKSEGTDWFAPGGILTVSLGGIFLIVREIKSIKDMDLQKYKTRAETAETKADQETSKLAAQIERLEKKLDKALEDVEEKHDEWVAEVAHRRKLEVLLAENGIAVPHATVTVTVEDNTHH